MCPLEQQRVSLLLSCLGAIDHALQRSSSPDNTGSSRNDHLVTRLRALRALLQATTAEELIFFAARHPIRVPVYVHFHNCPRKGLLSWILYCIRAPLYYYETEQATVALHCLSRVWSRGFMGMMGNVLFEVNRAYNISRYIVIGNERLLANQRDFMRLGHRESLLLYAYLNIARGLLRQFLVQVRGQTAGDVVSGEELPKDPLIGLTYGSPNSSVASWSGDRETSKLSCKLVNSYSVDSVKKCRDEVPQKPREIRSIRHTAAPWPLENVAFGSVLLSIYRLTEECVRPVDQRFSQSPLTRASVRSKSQRYCTPFDPQYSHRHWLVWALAVIQITEFTNELSDLCVYEVLGPKSSLHPHVGKVLNFVCEHIFVQRVLKRLALLYHQCHLLRTACHAERELFFKVESRIAQTLRRCVDLGIHVESLIRLPLRTFKLWDEQLCNLSAFMFEDSIIQPKRRPICSDRHIEWKHSAQLWLGMIRSPTWLVRELHQPTMGAFGRLADAIVCATSQFTLLKLIRLTLSAISVCFGMVGFPPNAMRSFDRLRQRLQGQKVITSQSLVLGEILGLRCCYALAKAEVHLRLRERSFALRNVQVDLAVPEFRSLKLVQKIISLAARTNVHSLAAKVWHERGQKYPDVQLLESSAPHIQGFPRLTSYVATSRQEWLLCDSLRPRSSAPSRLLRGAVTATALEDMHPIASHVTAFPDLPVYSKEVHVTLPDVVQYCARIELEALLALILEGANFYSAIWHVERVDFAACKLVQVRRYPMNTVGFYLIPVADPAWAPRVVQRRIKEMSIQHTIELMNRPPDNLQYSTQSASVSNGIQAVSTQHGPPPITELSEGIGFVLAHFILWTTAAWCGISNIALIKEPGSSALAWQDSSPPRRLSNLDRTPPSFSQKETHELSDNGVRSPLPLGSPVDPEVLSGDESSASLPSSRDSFEGTREIPSNVKSCVVPRTGRSQSSSSIVEQGSTMNMKSTFLFWTTLAGRFSRRLFPFVIPREEALWGGRFHPLMSLITPSLGKMYVESRLHRDTMGAEIEAEMRVALHDLIFESRVLIRNRPSVHGHAWSVNSRHPEMWDWAVILKIVGVILLTSMTSVRVSDALVQFLRSLIEYFWPGTSLSGQDIAIISTSAVLPTTNETFAFPGVTSVLLLRMAMLYTPTNTSETQKMDSLITHMLRRLRNATIKDLATILEAPTIHHERLSSVTCTALHLLNGSECEQNTVILSLLSRLARHRINELAILEVRLLALSLSPVVKRGHFDLLCTLLHSAENPMHVYEILAIVGDQYSNTSCESGGWGPNIQRELETFFVTLLRVRRRFLDVVINSQWRQNLREAPYLPFAFSLLMSSLDWHLSVVSATCRLLPMSELLPLAPNGCARTFAELWEQSEILPWSVRRAILNKLDMFPSQEVSEALRTWLNALSVGHLPQGAPLILRGEVYSGFARMASDWAGRLPHHILDYQLGVTPSNMEIFDFGSRLVQIRIATKERTRSISSHRISAVSGKPGRSLRLPFQPISASQHGPFPSSQVQMNVTIKRTRLSGVPRHLWGADDCLDTSPNALPFFLHLQFGDVTWKLPVTMRAAAAAADVVADMLQELDPLSSGSTHFLWPYILYPEVDLQPDCSASRLKRALTLSSFYQWLKIPRFLDGSKARQGLQNWSTDMTISYSDGHSQWFTGTVIFPEPLWNVLAAEDPQKMIKCCLAVHTMTNFRPDGANPLGPTSEVYMNQFGEVAREPTWHIERIGSIIDTWRMTHPTTQDFRLASREGSQYKWICADSRDSIRKDFHLVGCTFLYRIYLFHSDEEIEWYTSRVSALKRRMTRRRQRFVPDDMTAEEKLVTIDPELVSIIDTVHKIGIGSRRAINAWTSPSRNFGSDIHGSVLATIAQTGVGRELIEDDIARLDGSDLLKHPAVVTRLLGLAVELGGCWDPQTRFLTILGISLGPLGNYQNASIVVALSQLGDALLTNPHINEDRKVPLSNFGGSPVRTNLLTDHPQSIITLFRELHTAVQPESVTSVDNRESTEREGDEGFESCMSDSDENPDSSCYDSLIRSENPGFDFSQEIEESYGPLWSHGTVHSAERRPSMRPTTCQMSTTVSARRLSRPELAFTGEHRAILVLLNALQNVVATRVQQLSSRLQHLGKERPELFASIELWWRIVNLMESGRMSFETIRELLKITDRIPPPQNPNPMRLVDHFNLWDTLELSWRFVAARKPDQIP